MSELEDIIEGDDLAVTIEDPPPCIDDGLAVRLIARRRHRLAEQAAFDDQWNRMMEPLLLHRQQVTDRNRAEVERIETLLGQMLAARRSDDPKLTKIDLPGATLKTRVQQPEWIYGDEFIAWAEEYGRDDLLRHKTEIDKNAVKKSRVITLPDGRPGDTVQPVDPTTGEVVPGVTVTFRAPKLVIES